MFFLAVALERCCQSIRARVFFMTGDDLERSDVHRHCSTMNGSLLLIVSPGNFTKTGPLVAPPGTVAMIRCLDLGMNFAGEPLKVTLVAPVRSVPTIPTLVPALPEVGSRSTNCPRPTPKLYSVPAPFSPPEEVEPKKIPFVN